LNPAAQLNSLNGAAESGSTYFFSFVVLPPLAFPDPLAELDVLLLSEPEYPFVKALSVLKEWLICAR